MSARPPRPGSGEHSHRGLPVLLTLRGYQGAWLAGDAVAGLTLLAIAVPEQMATARLGNMPAISGLYAFVAGSLLIVLLGASRQMSVGADSTIAPVFAAGVAALAVAGSPGYQQLVSFLAIFVGTVLVLVGLFKLGWIADFISSSVSTGILAGIALEILLRQVPAVLGLPGGGDTTVQRLQKIAHQLHQTSGWALAIAALVLGLIVAAEKVDRRLPGALIGLVVSVAGVAALHLKAHGVRVLGTIPGGLPNLGVPAIPARDIAKLAATALTVAFVCVVQTAATARSLTGGEGAGPNLDHDLAGVGVGSIVAGLAGSFPVNASPPRSEVVAASGGRSQVSGLVAASGAVLVVAFATGLLADLPQATLGAILIYVATRLFHWKELQAIRRFSALEYGLALATIAAVTFAGIEVGVLVALGLSLGDRVRRASRPKDEILGRAVGTDHWIPTDTGHPTEQVPGILVYLLLSPLWFGNAQHVVERLRSLVDAADPPLHGLVLNATGMSDDDYTGAQALDGLVKDLKGRGITVAVARASGAVPEGLSRSVLGRDIGPGMVFDSVAGAVEALAAPTPAPGTPAQP